MCSKEEILQEAILQLRQNFYLDTELFFEDLTKTKGRKLTQLDKIYLCKQLLGCSPVLITKELNPELSEGTTEFRNRLRNLRTSLSRTVNTYITEFLYNQVYEGDIETEEAENLVTEKRKNWSLICQHLVNNKYKLSAVEIITLEYPKINSSKLAEIIEQMLKKLSQEWQKVKIVQWLKQQIDKYQEKKS